VPIEPDQRRTSETSPCDQLIGEGRAEEDRPWTSMRARWMWTAIPATPRQNAMNNPSRARGAEQRRRRGPAIDEHGDIDTTLAQHLHAQIGAVAREAKLAFIARFLIDQLDEAGYLPMSLRELPRICACLWPGGGAGPGQDAGTDRGGRAQPAECIALQAKRSGPLRPGHGALIDNLELVARGEFVRLKRMCGVDDEDLADMLPNCAAMIPSPACAMAAGLPRPWCPTS
jgi:RNA polymerase sigma-54 factor